MHHLKAVQLGHRYGRHWLFRQLSFELTAGEALVITGENGSGKSTLLRILAGQMAASEGSLTFTEDAKAIEVERWYRYLSWSAPAIELYGELTVAEATEWHFRLKDCLLASSNAVLENLELSPLRKQQVRSLSSGQQQRLRVGLALFSASPLLLLDEPTAFMDSRQAERILALIDTYRQGRLYILASNRPDEYVNLAGAKWLDLGA
jgi:ABC-type multidrug transport system ATPase subunit